MMNTRSESSGHLADTNSGHVFAFRCACGATLRASNSMIGKRGTCKACGVKLIISAPATHGTVPSNKSPPVPDNLVTAVPVIGICSVCQCPIGKDESVTHCSGCALPYHTECWDANYGCAAYGCSNVNLLKTAPDIAIPNSSGPPPLPAELLAAWMPSEELPWEFLLMAASVLLGLLSCVMFGVPSLAVAGAAGLLLAVRPQTRIDILALIWGIAGVTFLLGIVMSCQLYL